MKEKRARIDKKVKDIICGIGCLEESQIKEESDFIDDLGLDSLDCVEIIMCVEDELDIDVTDEEISPIKTYGQLLDFLVEKA